MKLQLADKPSFKDKVKRLGLILTSPAWIGPATAWKTIWSNMPQAEKNRQALNMNIVKADLNRLAARDLFAKMNFENADFLMEKLPLVIQDTQMALARVKPGDLGDQRSKARYLKSQNQILEEIYAWSTANLPPDPETTKLPAPIKKDPKLKTQPGETETFPDADKSTDAAAKKWYEQPAYLVGAAVVAVLVLPKLLKR
jgi:hypothetical protein